MQLPLKLTFDQLTTRWKSILDPVLSNSLNNCSILSNIPLVVGSNTINHKLGQMQQGWFIVDINGVASIYRSAPFNDLTLTLTSNAAVTVSLGVF
jgi:hypothetical protein